MKTFAVFSLALAVMNFSSVPSRAAGNPFFNDIENFRNQSLSLRTEKQNLEATSDLLLSRKLFWTPAVSLSANETQTQLNKTLVNDQNYLQADINMNLFRGGSDWNSLQSAKAKNRAQELQVLNESLQVEIKAADLIFKSLYLSEIRRIQQQFYKMKEESHKIVSDRFTQGKTPLQEVTKSEVDLVQQKNKVRNADLELSENKSQIGSAFVSELQTQSWPFSETASVRIPSNSKFPLPEQKFWQSQSLEEAWRSAKGGHWPSLDLTLQYQELPIQERNTNQWVGLLRFTLPLWTRYETSSQISSIYAQYVGAQNDFKQTEQNLKLRSIFLKDKVEMTRMNLLDAKKNLEKSRGLYRDILKSFRAGRMSTNDLFLEQNRLLESENSLTLSQLSFHQTLIEICALSGLKSADCLQ
jgi:outer membrane protein TolC